jgi:hypothetical protein
MDGDIIQGFESVCGSLSFVSSAVMIWKLQNEKNKNFTNPILLFLFSLLLALSFVLAIGRAAFAKASFCKFQGFIVQWTFNALMLWLIFLSYLMYFWIVQKQHPKRMEKLITRNLLSILFVSFIIAIINLGLNYYDDTYVWCWISGKHVIARFLCFECFLIGAWIINVCSLFSIHQSLLKRFKKATFHEKISQLFDNTRDTPIQTKLLVYLVMFSVVWFFSLLNRVVETITGQTVFIIALLEAIFVPLQGFLYASAYSNLVKRKFCRVVKESAVTILHLDKETNSSSSFTTEREEMVPLPGSDTTATTPRQQQLQHHIKGYIPKKYSIYITTFNMGEAKVQKVQTSVKDWIVEGHDVYAIGVQECMDYSEIKETILNHLGGPSKYQLYSVAIGSDTKSLGFHGYIALMVFVKTSEVNDGNIQLTVPAKSTMATGTDLIITTATNKGAVGIPLQIHDTSLGFVTCHLPSDSKGKSKLIKRNASAHAILKEVTLAPEDLGFDLHLQHDHVFVFGDLNYRMDTNQDGGGVNSLTGVTVASAIEKQTLGDDPMWIARKFNLLRHQSDPFHPTLSDIKLIHNAKNNSRGAWKSVLRADELRSIMDDGDAFYCFEEPMPTFPPSYKRRKGDIEADCGDYTEFEKVIKGYSNTGYIENQLVGDETTTTASAAAAASRDRSASSAAVSANAFLTRTKSKNAVLSPQEDIEEASPSFDEAYKHNHEDTSKEDELTYRQDINDNKPKRTGMSRYILSRGNSSAIVTGDVISRQSPSFSVKPEKEDPSKLRPPSYTDRVLMHSLEDRKNRVTIQAYDTCDLVRISDHRPVSMTLLLEVNSAVYFHESIAADQKKNSKQDQETKNSNAEKHGPHFELYELLISDFAVILIDIMFDEEEEEESENEINRDSMNPSLVVETTTNPLQREMSVDSVASSSLVSFSETSLSKAFELMNESVSERGSETVDSSIVRPNSGKKSLRFDDDNESSSLSSSSSQQQQQQEQSTSVAVNKDESSSSALTSSSSPNLPTSSSSPERRPRGKTTLLNKTLSIELSTIGGDNSTTTTNNPTQATERRPRAKTQVKGKRRSIFQTIFGLGGEEVEEKEENEDDILRDMARDSLQWQNTLNEPGLWRKKVIEEERERQREKEGKALKNLPIKKKKKKLNERRVDQITVVFPLPSKDPLLSYRRLQDYSAAFNIDDQEKQDENDIENNMYDMFFFLNLILSL